MNALFQLPEPEVVQSTLAKANCRSLARIVADLINANEPLLKAEHDGATVTVNERGGPCAMQFTVDVIHSIHREAGLPNKLPASN